MKIRVAVLIAFCFCVVSRLHASGLVDGNQLLKQCQVVINREGGQAVSAHEKDDSLLCLAYIEGVLDTQGATNDLHPGIKTFRYCVPDEVPVIQSVRIIVQFLKEHPKNLNVRASLLVLGAMVDAFPCKTP